MDRLSRLSSRESRGRGRLTLGAGGASSATRPALEYTLRPTTRHVSRSTIIQGNGIIHNTTKQQRSSAV